MVEELAVTENQSRSDGPKVITLVLSDDHQVVREGLRSLLEAEPDFKVVGDTGDGLEAVRMVEKLQPDVLVQDLLMNGINGLEITRQINQKSLNTKVIIFSMYSDESYVLEALRAGAKGYVLKASNLSELVRAIREVNAGHRF